MGLLGHAASTIGRVTWSANRAAEVLFFAIGGGPRSASDMVETMGVRPRLGETTWRK
jgi:hypothetical protein